MTVENRGAAPGGGRQPDGPPGPGPQVGPGPTGWLTAQDTSVSARICHHVSAVTGHSPARITPATAFAELGLDSLMAVRIRTALEREFGIELPLRDLLGAGTIEATVSRIQRALARSGAPAEAGPTKPLSAEAVTTEAAPVEAVAVEAMPVKAVAVETMSAEEGRAPVSAGVASVVGARARPTVPARAGGARLATPPAVAGEIALPPP
ncbi:acyl carrier protein, partial [Streptomyces sp. MB09-02B]|uniref:acyl carrier protein n=1 Tax=Streptomyces sp. MB09-02B TaxID=3028667 RepID=UPI0029AAE84A